MILAILGFLFYMASEWEEHARDNRFPKSWGKWWNTDTSWVNKHRWYPSWFWKTAGVPFTDAEHAFELLQKLACLFALLASQGNLESVLWFYGGTVAGGLFKEIFLKNVQ